MNDNSSTDERYGSPVLSIVDSKNLSCFTCTRPNVGGFGVKSSNPNRQHVVHLCFRCMKNLVEFCGND